jgi:hypothetical protein
MAEKLASDFRTKLFTIFRCFLDIIFHGIASIVDKILLWFFFENFLNPFLSITLLSSQIFSLILLKKYHGSVE